MAKSDGIRSRAGRAVLLFALCFGAIPRCFGAEGEGGGKGLALCIGVGGYDDFPPVATAVDGAAGRARLLRASGAFRRVLTLTGFDADGKSAKPGAAPTGDAILNAVRLVSNNAPRDGDLVVYFNGRGAMRRGAVFLLPSDARGGDADSPGIPLAEVTDIMAKSRAASKTLILDACHGGGFSPAAAGSAAAHDDIAVIVECGGGHGSNGPDGAPAPSAAMPPATAGATGAGLVSDMIHPINAGSEKGGLRLVRAVDLDGGIMPGLFSPTQAFEIIRPGMGEITIARLGVSCACIQVVAEKRTFAKGERAVLELRNVAPTPPRGMSYSIYVLVTSPGRVTLRQTAFVRSEKGMGD